jgi:Tfp pilus assembly protein PilF
MMPRLKSPLLEICRRAAIAIAAATLCTGCAGNKASRNSPYTALGETDRNTAEAERLTREAAEVMDTHPNNAEKLLRDALGKDLYHGPAHNNLGVIFLSRGELYSAASEFEFARKLMPGHPDPRINLALTLERAGRVEDAMNNYAAALEVYPDHIGAMQGLVRLQVKHNHPDDGTRQRLQEVALRGESEPWRRWAAAALASAKNP